MANNPRDRCFCGTSYTLTAFTAKPAAGSVPREYRFCVALKDDHQDKKQNKTKTVSLI